MSNTPNALVGITPEQLTQAAAAPQTQTPGGDSLSGIQQASSPDTNQPPKASDYNTPNGLQLLMQLIRPSNGPMPSPVSGAVPPRPASRLDAFESFLGNFMQSLSAGMQAQGTGQGSFGRGLGAAMQAPYQRDVGQFQMQQQARQQQAAIQAQQSEAQLRQAQTQQAQMETQLAPERLKLDTQLKLQQQQMMNMWYGGRLQQGGEKIDLTRANQQFTQDYKKQQLDLENRVQTGKLNVAQELASYNRMDDASKATYRVAMAQGIQGRLIVAQQALQAASTLKSAQAVKTATDAANQYNMFARIGRSLGLEDDLGMSLPEMQIPNVAVGAPTTVPITSPAAGRGAPSANPFRH